MTRPTLSALLINFNHGGRLDTSLGAILSQADPADEVIVVDDGSTDDSVTIIERMARAAPQVRVIRHPQNRGVQEAGWSALSAARGDYVAWLASDDEVLPGFFGHARAAVTSHPQAGVFFGTVVLPNPVPLGLDGNDGFLGPDAFLAQLRQRYLWISPNATFMNRRSLLAAGGWRRELEWLSDWFSTYALALRYGAAWTAAPCARINLAADSYSQANRIAASRRRIYRQLLEVLAEPSNRDVRSAFRAAPIALLQPLGPSVLGSLARSPRDWDLLASALPLKLRISIGARLRPR